MGAVEAAARPPPTPLFVGRDEELSCLHDALRRSAAGRPGMLLLAGEAGVGKSRLVSRFADEAGRAGTLVAVGGAAPLTGGALPYAPLLQALRAADDHGSGAVGELGAELAGVLAGLTGDRPAAERMREPEVGRGLLFERICDVLIRLGCIGPVLLVLEDLHWADSATLDVLAFVLRTLRGARLLVVGTYRADDPGELLAGWLAETRRWPEVGWLELPRFTRAELAEQLSGLRGGLVDSQVVAEVFDRSQGNPFFAEQLFAAGRAGPGRLPGLLREVLLARVRQLSPAGQRLLREAAVAGRWVCHDWLAAVAGRPDEELTESLREAVDRGLLHIIPVEQAGQEVYEFRHALLQEAVYGELLPAQRARLHGAYASVLAGLPAAVPQFAAELAEHCYRAGQPAQALTWSVRAASRAERVYAHGEAARHCERVLELWDQVPGAAGRAGADRAGLHTRVARDWEYAGDETRALSHVEEALRQVDPAADPVRAGLLHNLRGWYGALRGWDDAGANDLDMMLADNREAVRLVPAEPPSAARAQVLFGYGRALEVQAGRHDEEAAAVHDQALAAARQAGSQPDIVPAMASLGYLRAVQGQVDAGIALLQEAHALDLRLGGDARGLYAASMPPAVLGLSDVLLKANRLEEAAEMATKGWHRLRQDGLADHRHAFLLLAIAVEALFGLGRWDEAAQISQPVTDQPVTAANAVLHGVAAELEGARGQLGTALARLDRAREQHRSRLGPESARELGQRHAEVQLWLDRPQTALAEAIQALDTITGTGQERFAGWLFCLGARALADLAEWAQARQDLTTVASHRQHGSLLARRLTDMTYHPLAPGTPMPATAAAERALWDAELTRLNGAADPAAWQAAADTWQQLRRPYPAAYAQWRRAEALLTSGAGADPAAGPLRAAHAAAASLGAAPLRTQLEVLARRARISLAPAGPEPAPAPARPHGLTDREADVLRLLAAGHTNREIGQQLFISPKTASVHVTSILRKLAVRDRVQAAAIAIRLGLADPPTPAAATNLPPPARSNAKAAGTSPSAQPACKGSGPRA
jgi:DNA-binding CsgD family transcriptional regulator/tetratricopeptide (TPR) repeat protein